MTSASGVKDYPTVEIWFRNIVVVFALILFASSSLHSQGANPQTGSMVHYAMIFRSQRILTVGQERQREAEIQAWAKRVRDMGVTLDPRILGGTDAYFQADSDHALSPKDASSLGAIIFFDAASKEQAIEVARSHPGPRYGVMVELREWQAPPTPGAKK